MIEDRITPRTEALELIKGLLVDMGYPSDDDVVDGVVGMVNMLSDYHEEGQALFPEVLLANKEDYFKTFINKRVKLKEKSLEKGDFSQCIKMCAPLAIDGWCIYVLLLDERRIEYGVLTSEITALSLDLYSQTMSAGVPEINALYLRNAGSKTVEIRNVQSRFYVSLNLNDKYTPLDSVVEELVKTILPNDVDYYTEKSNFLVKNIRQALNEGHGNLIAVSDHNPDVIKRVTSNFHGGMELEENAIDFNRSTNNCLSIKNEEASRELISYSRLMQSMLNFDGITLFSDDGRIVGYHFIVNNDKVTEEGIEGGSRTRAYRALCKIDGLKACFMKSQDGRIEYLIK